MTDDQGCTPLHRAACFDCSEVLDFLLDHSADTEAKIPASKETALHLATKMKHPNCVKKLLDGGANPNAQMQNGYRALHLASSGKCADSFVVEELLKKGAEIEATDDEGATAFHYAARDNCFDVMEILIKHEANCAAKNITDNTPLHLAAKHGHFDVCQTLIEKNHSLVHSTSTLGFTPLHEAAVGGHTEIIELLIENEADIETTDIVGATPLLNSVFKDQEKAFRALLKAGANINAVEENLNNILHAAASTQSKMSFMFNNKNVLEKIKPLILKTNKAECTPLHKAAQSGNAEVAELLLKHGAAVEARDKNGFTPLHTAASFNQTKVVDVLLRSGANKEARDSINMATPLYFPSVAGYMEVVKVLVDSGAGLEEKDETGGTPLSFATRKQRSLVAEYLLSKGADPKSQNVKNITPFHWASINGDLQILKLFLEKCNDGLDLEDLDRRTPLDCAKQYGHLEVVNFIQEHRVKPLKTSTSPQKYLYLFRPNS